MAVTVPIRGRASFNLPRLLAKIGTAFEYHKGQTVFSQGDVADSVFYIQKGEMKLSVLSGSGKEAIIAILGADSFFGEGCLAAERVRMATATAIRPGRVLKIERETMTLVLHEEHSFSDFFIRHMLLRNIRVQADLVDQLFNSTEKRLARALLLLAHYGNGDRPTIDVPKISQETLAAMIGTTRARVSVFMNKFRKLGFIDYNGGLQVHTSLLNVVLHD
jgi:CRP-like cAMP-binding protein